jgi:predicted metal-dependent hydrolase
MTDITIDQIIRTRRRSISLLITKEAKLIVRAPHATSLTYIESLIRDKASWIKTKQDYFRSKPQASPKTFIDGETYLVLGQNHPLRIVDDLPKAVILEDTLKLSAHVRNPREHIRIWYKQFALDYISKRVKELADENHLIFRSVKVNEAKTRWGSCGYQGALNFSWRLIMAPPRVVDYVIIHELMHIKQRNHSAKFWHEVQMRIPNYKQDEHWLSQNSNLLSL